MEPLSDRPAAARSDRAQRTGPGNGDRSATRQATNGNGRANDGRPDDGRRNERRPNDGRPNDGRANAAQAPGRDEGAPRDEPRAASPPASCTSAQLRRFIKSRPYVPMHELRRRFELNGGSDEVSAISTPQGVVYVGLPGRESQLIAELVRQGDVGLELCRDPFAPMVVGVYPMRPITRQ
jgi:hypothetical protein